MTKRIFGLTMTAAIAATLSLACDDDSSSGPKADAGKDAAAEAAAPADAGDAGDGSTLDETQARGKYLVDHVIACGDCHTPQTATGPDLTKYLAGNPDFAVLPNGDKLGTRNLTNDPTGLKNRSDQEIKDMFMKGLRPPATGATDPEPLNPVMPYYVFHNMTDADADAIVAYLRTVPAVEHEIPRRGASFDVPAPAAALDLSKVPLPADTFEEKASAMRGRYLVAQTGLCVECHTKHTEPGSPTVLDEAHLFEGNEDFSSFFAALMIKPVSKNLTSDNETGLGTWSSDEILHAITMGKAKDGSGICPPMPIGAYMGLTATDATDIVNYIRSLPPKASLIPDMCVFPPAPPADGGASDASTADAPVEGGATTDAAADGGVAADAGDTGT